MPYEKWDRNPNLLLWDRPVLRPRKIRVGEWTFVLIFERIDVPNEEYIYKVRLRYAFVTAASEPKHNTRSASRRSDEEFSNIVVANIDEYLNHMFPDNEAARKRLGNHWTHRLRSTSDNPYVAIMESSRDEILSWLRSNDFTEEDRMDMGGKAKSTTTSSVPRKRKNGRFAK